ncbi:MAG: hypothetical protein AB1529_06935 [Candidatus Micrarchaeota archaeon]
MEEYYSLLRKRFTTVMVGTDQRERENERKALEMSESPDIRKMAGIADAIHKAVRRNGSPDELLKAMKAFDELPGTSFWSSCMEEAAGVVLARALSLGQEDPCKPKMLEYGVAMAGRAMSAGFPLSKETVSRVKAVKEVEPALSNLVDIALMMNSALTPSRPEGTQFRPKAKEGEVRGRTRGRVASG